MCARVDFIEQSLIEDEADFLEEGIIKFFAKYGANIDIPKWWHNNSRFIFKIKRKAIPVKPMSEPTHQMSKPD